MKRNHVGLVPEKELIYGNISITLYLKWLPHTYTWKKWELYINVFYFNNKWYELFKVKINCFSWNRSERIGRVSLNALIYGRSVVTVLSTAPACRFQRLHTRSPSQSLVNAAPETCPVENPVILRRLFLWRDLPTF